MSTLDGQDLFGSGPHRIRPEGPKRALQTRRFAGLSGELVIDMGACSRQIVQDGRLQAPSAAELNAMIVAIEALADGQLHTLQDNHGRQFQRVVIEEFQPTTPIQAGRGYWCEYTLHYRQLS